MNIESTIQVLLQDTSENSAEEFLCMLEKKNIKTSSRRVTEKSELYEMLKCQTWDMVLANEEVHELNVEECAEIINKINEDVSLVLLSTEGLSIEKLTSAYKKGASAVVSLDHPEYSMEVITREFLASRKNRKLNIIEGEKEQLRDQRDQLIQNTNEPIVFIHDGIHIHANEAYLEMAGYKESDELLYLPFIDTIADHDKARVKQELQKIYQFQFHSSLSKSDFEISDVTLLNSNEEELQVKLLVDSAVYEGEKCLQVVLTDYAKSGIQAPTNSVETITPTSNSTPNDTSLKGENVEPEIITNNPIEAVSLFSEEKDDEQKSADVISFAESSAAVKARIIENENENELDAHFEISKEEVTSAIHKGKLSLTYSPIIEVSEVEPEFYDIDLFVTDSSGKTFSPEKYLPTINGSSIAFKLDQWQLENVFEVMSNLYNQGQSLHFLVSLSLRSITDKKMPDYIKDSLNIFGLVGEMLSLEFSSKDLINNLDLAKLQIPKFQNAGVRICLRDEDNNAEAHKLISELSIDLVKLSKQEVQEATSNASALEKLTKRTSQLHAAGARVIASHVEDKSTLNSICKTNVDLVKGGYFMEGSTELSIDALADQMVI